MNPAYTELASVYDRFMADAPDDCWLDWLDDQIPDLKDKTAADLGCGTGRFTVRLAPRVKRLVGVDASVAMLAVAYERARELRVPVQWLLQDLRNLRLPEPVHLLVSTCDSFNYLIDADDFRRALLAARHNLLPSGWLCFDLIGPSRVASLADGLSYDLDEEAAVIFTSAVAANGLVQYEVHAFLRQEDGDYRRIVEEHQQRFYRQEEVRALLQECGFTQVQVLGDFGHTPVSQAERWLVRAVREP
ncbi:class I SAM-dependent DNA methyltransferase [Alicyclobacillus shizuokensis]|uniref:class I SAM-dependent DNA methyltransferase n=1 Tax=Alicyclobacillus shizuokensis TaxID=392014 RepID=UPI00083011C3|nr:class I SAM-dependent methyltransferase [Alicyclobacillus shizuokensis]MCL6626153.1 class I SAM-dependent methyltransferase [Alicyclobacillus shizuokensis]